MNGPARIVVLAALVAGCDVAATPAAVSPSVAIATPAPTTTLAATATSTPAPSASLVPAVGPGEVWVAFQGDQGGGQYGIRLVRPDGTGMHALAPDVPGQYQLHPDWSPDGSTVVFAEVGSTVTDLWLADADGGNLRHIVDCTTSCTLADEPSFSPDGTQIAFHRQAFVDGAFVSTLELYDVATGQSHVVLQAAADRVVFAPRWAPDGHRVVVENVHRKPGGTADDIDAGQLVTVDTAATHPKTMPITGPDYWPGNPEWSPNADVIAFFRPMTSAGFDGPTDIWTIRPDGSGLTRLTHLADDGGGAIHPAWAPDGTHLLFVASGGSWGDATIATIAPDGSDLQPATPGGVVQGLHPRLRPIP